MSRPEPKCAACNRTTETHAPGCSLLECPHRKAQAWCGTDGTQGFPGTLAEERILIRRAQRSDAVAVELGDL